MKTLPYLDWKYPGTPAALVCLSCYVRIPPTSASHGTVSSKMSTIFWEVDHMTRSGLRLVVRISHSKNNLWSRSTCILQSRAASRRVVSILADGFAGSCPALMNTVVFGGPGIGGGRALLILPEWLPVVLGPGCVSRCSGLGTNGFCSRWGCDSVLQGFGKVHKKDLLRTIVLGSWAWKEHRMWLWWWSWFGFLPFPKDPSMWAYDAPPVHLTASSCCRTWATTSFQNPPLHAAPVSQCPHAREL